MSVEPVKPSDMIIRFPDAVIEVWNSLITVFFNGRESRVLQSEAVAALSQKLDVNRRVILDSKYLDIEDVYRAAGWTVTYDKPAYNESYEPFFIFTRK